MHARATFKRRASDESSRNRTGLGLPLARGYSLTLVGVVGQEPVRDARLARRSRPLEELVPLGLVALGLALGALSLLIYIVNGYSHGMLWLWLAGVAVTSIGFGLRARVWPRIPLSTSASRPA